MLRSLPSPKEDDPSNSLVISPIAGELSTSMLLWKLRVQSIVREESSGWIRSIEKVDGEG